jgi:hypothetical protein
MVAALLAIVSGCCVNRPTARSIAAGTRPGMGTTVPVATISAPAWDGDLNSLVTPPLGWKPDPLKVTNKSRHRVWISPGGSTAYGVIYFDLPLPVGKDIAFNGFISGMKNTSGEAILISKTEDSDAVHFVADGGLYRIRCDLSVSGFHGWAVYAGTLRAKPVNLDELKIAEEARDKTRVGGR